MYFFAFFRQGPWDAYDVYASDFRIAIQSADAGPAMLGVEGAYWDRWEMASRMSQILSCALPNATQGSDPGAIETLLDIYGAAYGCEHPGDLEDLGKELEHAVRNGILRVDRLPERVPIFSTPRISERPPGQGVEGTFVAFRLVDPDGEPVARCAYRLTLPDQSVVEGTVNAQGRALHDQIKAGTCKLVFPALDARDFAPSSREAGKDSELDKGPVRPPKPEKEEEQTEEDPSKIHVVRPGDTLASIGQERGFRNDRTIWNAGENAKLRARRAYAQALLPGDRVTLPEPKLKEFSIATGAEEKITVYLSRLELGVKFLDAAGAPRANEEREVTADSAKRELPTDGSGKLRVPLLAANQMVTLTAAESDDAVGLHVGALPPLNEAAGAKARLANLGYVATLPFAPVLEAPDDANVIGSHDYQLAVELFQDDQQLKIQPELASEWIDKLKEISET